MLRDFIDDDGTEWRVWDVLPSLHARPSSSGKRKMFTRIPEGWLCFESATERRRLTPIPPDWEVVDHHALAAMCAQAKAVTRREAADERDGVPTRARDSAERG